MGRDRVRASAATVALIMAISACSGGNGERVTATTRASTTTTTLTEDLGALTAPSVTASIAMIGGPDWLATDGTSVWAKRDDGKLVRISPESNTVTAELELVGPETCSGLGAGFGAIWACDDGHVVRVDPTTATIAATIPVDKFSVQGHLATGFDRVWVLIDDGTTLAGIDPATNAVATEIELGATGVEVALGDDSIWVSVPAEGVFRIDPIEGAVTGRVKGLPGVRAIAAGDAVWAAFPGGVARIDASTLKVTARVGVTSPVGITTLGLFATGDTVWVRTEGPAFLRRLDPESGAVVESFAPPEDEDGGSVLVAFGSVWASAYDSSRVFRIT